MLTIPVWLNTTYSQSLTARFRLWRSSWSDLPIRTYAWVITWVMLLEYLQLKKTFLIIIKQSYTRRVRLYVADRIILDSLKCDLASEQISYVCDVVVDHGWAFKTQSPCNNANIFFKTHGFKHFRSENSAISDFDPSFEHRVESENFKWWFGVRVVCRLILEVGHSDFLKESVHYSK